MIQKKKPKHTLEERGIFVRTANTNNGRSKEDIDRESDNEFYQYIWDEREHVCFETGKPLGSELLSLYMHHILPKAKYPMYTHQKWNIVLLSQDSHSQVETFIDKCPRVKALTEHLKIVYG